MNCSGIAYLVKGISDVFNLLDLMSLMIQEGTGQTYWSITRLAVIFNGFSLVYSAVIIMIILVFSLCYW